MDHMYDKIERKKTYRIGLIGLFAFILSLALFSNDVSGAKKNNRPKSIHTYVTYHKLFVGQEIGLKVAPRKATVKVRFIPEHKANKKMGVSVSSSNSRVIRVIKVNKFHFKLKAVKPGNVSITIKSLGKGYYGKKLAAKIRLRVEERKPLVSLSASGADANSIKLSFDSEIKDKFDISELKIKLYDKKNETFIKEIPINNFEYLKDSEYDVLVKLPTEFQSNSTYRIEYRNLYTELETDEIGVADLKLVNLKIPKKQFVPLEFKAFDKDGRDITDTGYFKQDLLRIKLLEHTDSKMNISGEGSNSGIFMLEPGSKAKIEVSYNEIKKNFELVCEDNIDSSLYNLYKAAVTYKDYRVNWDEIKENDPPVLEKGKTDGFIAVLVKTKDGKFISNRINDKFYEPTASFQYSVRKGVKLKVDERSGSLGTAKEGRYSVNVKMTYQDNVYQYSVPVKIEETKGGLLNINPSDVTISNKEGKKEVRLLYQDAKGKVIEERDISSKPVIRYTNSDADSTKSNFEPDKLFGLVKNSSSKLKLDIDAVGKPAGTYYYEISFMDAKKNSVKSYLTVHIQDSTSDSTVWDYKFKEVIENSSLDLQMNSHDSLSDIQERAKGVSLGLYAYNQFGTSIGLSHPIRYKINGELINPVKMPYIKYDNGIPYFTPYELVNENGRYSLNKLAKPGFYRIEAEVYNNRINSVQTYFTMIRVTDNTALLQENVDFKVKRTGEHGGTTVLQPGMSETPSNLASQLVTKMDGSKFIPPVKATGFDSRYPTVSVSYMSYGNSYIIDKVSIPVSFVTRDGIEIFIYVEHLMNIYLTR